MWKFALNDYLCIEGYSLPFQHHTKDKTMQPIGNKLYRSTSRRVEEAAGIDKQISKLEDDVRKLKIDFDIYFNGATKRPPLEARARLESYIKRVSDNRALTYSQRYQLNAIISRFTSYRELWRRTLRARGDDLL